MAKNRLPDKQDRLFSLCEDMCDGLGALEVTLGVKQNTETVMRAALAAARSSETAYGDAKVAKKEANKMVTDADKEARVFIGNSRKRLAKFFGEAYSTEWSAAGWPGNSTAMPSTQDERFELVAKLKAWFTGHAAHESADMETTAAIADLIHTAYSNARAALANKIGLAGAAKAARDAAEENLRSRMRGLIEELDVVLSDEDPRWHDFGLSRPADEDAPEAPGIVMLTAGVPQTLLADWDDALRADHYRVWVLVVGVDTEFHAVQSPSDSDATLPGLPSGATVKVRVTSVNSAGESLPGPEAEAVVP